jgi:predicted Zn-dependent protease
MNAIYRMAVPIFITGLLTCGCAINKSEVGGFNLISVSEEKNLGDQFAQEVEKQHQVVHDPDVQALVDRVGHRLLTGARKVDFPYTFKVVKDDSVNAFALPGGHVYINTGLIKAAQSEDELAGVMAHEINHVVARHSTQQMTKQYGYELIASLLLGQNAGTLTKLATELFGQAGSMYYSREMESQADFLGVETMYKAGYDPHGMETFFEKLEAIGQKDPGKIARFFASHPQTADRIKDVREEISKLPPKHYLPPSDDFQQAKARL